MLRFKRPRPPRGYAAKARTAERSLRIAIAAGNTFSFDERIWKPHKGAFSTAQHGKCGYCETFARNHPAAVEHYAPKSVVHELHALGGEDKATASVLGRKTPEISSTGYWWLAYKWSNWLFACERCNSAWKRCLFPVRDQPRALPPHPKTPETPLLLHPLGRIDPLDHITFSSLGQIAPRHGSNLGKATIETCGLDRESLRAARGSIARDVQRHTDRLLSGLANGDEQRALDAVTDLLSLGSERRAHAGMVRALVWRFLGRPWDELGQLKAKLQRKLRTATRRRK